MLRFYIEIKTVEGLARLGSLGVPPALLTIIPKRRSISHGEVGSRETLAGERGWIPTRPTYTRRLATVKLYWHVRIGRE